MEGKVTSIHLELPPSLLLSSSDPLLELGKKLVGSFEKVDTLSRVRGCLLQIFLQASNRLSFVLLLRRGGADTSSFPPFVEDVDLSTHRDFLLYHDDGCILSSNGDGSDSRSSDGLERVL